MTRPGGHKCGGGPCALHTLKHCLCGCMQPECTVSWAQDTDGKRHTHPQTHMCPPDLEGSLCPPPAPPSSSSAPPPSPPAMSPWPSLASQKAMPNLREGLAATSASYRSSTVLMKWAGGSGEGGGEGSSGALEMGEEGMRIVCHQPVVLGGCTTDPVATKCLGVGGLAASPNP
jgi:hypothetical protein